MNKMTELKAIENQNYYAGISVPIFSLRSENGLGVGQFSDLKLLADICAKAGLSIIQLLPIQDTTIQMNDSDSSPYSVVSSFALHPIYLDFTDYLDWFTKKEMKEFNKLKTELNALSELNYERALWAKWTFATLLFEHIGKEIFHSEDYQEFFNKHQEWLRPYVAFSRLRELFGTANYTTWDEKYTRYSDKIYTELVKNKQHSELMHLELFVQFLLHQQLKEAREYCLQKGVFLKSDIPVGIMKHSVDAWTNPDLYHLGRQAGAPPDSFSSTGQNWGFPTYNWEKMAENNYSWWKARLTTMAEYFAAYRLDHILGFFRIWEMPNNAVRGLLGQFSPALAFTPEEIEEWGIPFREWGIERFTEPFIKDWVIDQIFGRDARDKIIQTYLKYVGFGNYTFKKKYNTQKKIAEVADLDKATRAGLYTLLENVIFIPDHQNESLYHPRIELTTTISFDEFGAEFQEKLRNLHENYFYQRNIEFWEEQAKQKLPAITGATSMLACGEDLGMVPSNVPIVMSDLGILRLILERVPAYNDYRTNLDEIPYLSVVTTSSHDTSTLRAFWEEDPEFSARYFSEILKLDGKAPETLSGDIAKKILMHNLNSPAMLRIFPIQDWLAINEQLRLAEPKKERINIPGTTEGNWRYRLHLSLEKLLKEESFIAEIREMVDHSKRK